MFYGKFKTNNKCDVPFLKYRFLLFSLCALLETI